MNLASFEAKLETALYLHSLGFNVIPGLSNKAPCTTWGKRQTERQTEQEVKALFARYRFSGFCVPCGFGTNNLLVIDVDSKGKPEREAYKKKVTTELENILPYATPKIQTVSGGYHYLIKCNSEYRNTPFAHRKKIDDDGEEKREVILEMRGQGGYVYWDHRYQVVSGDLSNIPELTPEQLEQVIEVCRSYQSDDTIRKEMKHRQKDIGNEFNLTPWDDYNNQLNASKDKRDALMSDAGLEFVRSAGERDFYLRTGSAAEQSGNYHGGRGLFYIFSTSTILPAEEGMSPFVVYAHVYHNGDFAEATKSAYKQGFGKRYTPSLNGTSSSPSEPNKNTGQIDANKITELAHESKIDFTTLLEAPPDCIYVKQALDLYPFCSLGNFTLVKGKAKSRKSYWTLMVVKAALSGICGNMQGDLPLGKKKVVLIDTEMASYMTQKRAMTIWDHLPANRKHLFDVHNLRKFSPAERLQIIDHIVMSGEGVGLVVIDGIRDLVTSINDEEQATKVSSQLLKWTEVKNCHIVVVLHENKGDNNARGHLGSECLNKAETTISITKDTKYPDQLSLVDFEYCRGKTPPKFAFRVDELGMPSFEEIKEEEKKGRANPISWHKTIRGDMLAKVFNGNELSYNDFRNGLQNEVHAMGFQFSKNDAELLVTWLVNTSGEVIKKGKDGTRNIRYEYPARVV